MHLRRDLSLASLAWVALAACADSRAPDPPNSTGSASGPSSSKTTDPSKSSPPAIETAAVASTSAPTASAKLALDPTKPRIYAKARFAWIQPQPRASKGWIGYLSLGASVALKGGSVEAAKVVGASGCDAWYAVEPRGYVCAGDAATIDPNDPAVVALAKDAPKTDAPFPYEYGESMGAPRYASLPSAAEQRQNEWDLEQHKAAIERARANPSDVDKGLAGVDLAPAGVEAPELFPFTPLVREARRFVAPGSTIAWTRQFDAGGRTWLLTSDQMLVPKDRVRPYPRSEFHGVELAGDVKLPIAFFRKQARPKLERQSDGSFKETGASWPRLAWVALTGESVTDPSTKQAVWATKDAGLWVRESDAAIASQATSAPWLKPDAPGRQTWIDVSVLGGTLVAYEGMTPVFATLISPGRGGIPFEGLDPLETASTPTGTFRVDGKFLTATMVSSTNDMIVHTEVQFVQNFHGPHALHGAYWHDAWGEPKSGGCVNLSPIDAKRVFGWTEPELPPGWYGMRSVPEVGWATIVNVHK